MAPRTLCCNAYTWKNIFSTKYKLSRTKNNCVHAQLGQIMNNKIPKDKKAPLALLKSRAEKQGAGSKSRGLGMPPALSTNKAVGKPPKPPLWPNSWTHHYPHPTEGSRSASLCSRREQARAPVTCSCCPPGPCPSAAAGAPIKALYEFLVWPLVNFY